MGSIAGSNIEWRFLIPVKITFNKAVPCADRIKAVYAAHKFEPAFSNRYICNLITHDDAKRICRFFITDQFQPVDHGWRHIKSARLKHKRCNRQPRQKVASAACHRPSCAGKSPQAAPKLASRSLHITNVVLRHRQRQASHDKNPPEAASW